MNTKSLKEFFRPTRVKVLFSIVFVFIFLIEIRLSLLLHYISPCWGTVIFMFPFIYPIYIFLFALGTYSTTIILIVVACIIFGYSYLFSCLITFLYRYLENFKYKFLKPLFVIYILLILFVPIPIHREGSFPESFPEPNKEKNFMSECSQYCYTNISEYCLYYFGKDESGLVDLNKNGMENDILEVGNQQWSACESRVYCFLSTPCRRLGSTQREVMKKCANLLCNNYLKEYKGNTTLASKAVLKEIVESNNSTECNFLKISDKDNWHKRFFPENVCEKYINKTKD